MGSLQILNSENLAEFLDLPSYVLVLSKSDCVACGQWQTEIEAAFADESLPEIAIGKLNLDQQGLSDFKRNNKWLKDVNDLPFNAIFKDGELKKSYAGAGLDRLMNRLKRLELMEQ